MHKNHAIPKGKKYRASVSNYLVSAYFFLQHFCSDQCAISKLDCHADHISGVPTLSATEKKKQEGKRS